MYAFSSDTIRDFKHLVSALAYIALEGIQLFRKEWYKI